MVLIRAQVAMEYLMVASFLLLLTLPMIVLFYQESVSFNNEIALAQTTKSINKIVNTANTVYYLGPPSKRTIQVYLPEGISSIDIINSSITVVVANKLQFTIESESSLNGSLSTNPGLHIVEVESKTNVTQIIG